MKKYKNFWHWYINQKAEFPITIVALIVTVLSNKLILSAGSEWPWERILMFIVMNFIFIGYIWKLVWIWNRHKNTDQNRK